MTVLLEVRDLVKRFGGFTAVDGVNFCVEAGTIHAIIGPNGAGKTTLFRLLTGLHAPSAGKILLAGQNIAGHSPHHITRLGLAQSFQLTTIFPALTVREQVMFALIAKTRESFDLFASLRAAFTGEHQNGARTMALLSEIGLADRAGELAARLSHGDQRALDVALALATGPRVLLLDEPTAGMSPFETERMVEMIQRLAQEFNLTVLFSEHDMNVVFGISDRITVLHRGQVIAEGNALDIQSNAEVTAVYLGSDA